MSELLRIFCFGISYCLEFNITSNSHTRIYCAQLATKIFPKYGNVEVMFLETRKTIINRLRRATKRSKFSRAACEFQWCCAKSKNVARSMTSLQFLLNFSPTLDNFKHFQWTRNWRFCRTMIDCSTDVFQRKSIDEFWFNRCFRKSSLWN